MNSNTCIYSAEALSARSQQVGRPLLWRKSGSIILSVVAILLSFSTATSAQPGSISLTNSPMQPGRLRPSATLLNSGDVLVIGGAGANSQVEAFNPSSGMFQTVGSISVGRTNHTATLLLNGKILITGGTDASGITLASAELYDPSTGMSTVTSTSLQTPRSNHRATLLHDGRVLVTGGLDSSNTALATSEIYDPATGAFSPSGTMQHSRALHSATLLNDNLVLIAGGANFSAHLACSTLQGVRCGPDPNTVWMDGEPSAELYNPATGVFTFTGSMQTGRWDHTATILPSGAVVILGGAQAAELHATGPFGVLIGVWTVIASAEVFDTASGVFIPVGSLNSARAAHNATLLGNGLIFIAGGETLGPNGSAMNSTELFNPLLGTATPGPALSIVRSHHTASAISHGPILLAGGQDNSAELYWPDGTPATVGSLKVAGIPLAWGYNWNGFFGGPCNPNWYTDGVSFSNDFTLSELRIPNHNNGYGGGFFIFEDSPATLYAASTASNVNFGDGVAKFFFASPLIRTGHTYFFDGIHVGPPGNDFFTGGLDNCGPSIWDFYSALPSMSAIAPSQGIQGETLTVTITGENFSSGDKVLINSSGIAINSISLIGSSQIVASLNISMNSSPGSYDVAVVGIDGRKATLPQAFTVNPLLPPSPPNGFLSFPLNKLTPDTVGITSVFDHHVRPDSQSGAPLFYKNDLDGVVVDYVGEEGDLSIGTDGSSCCPSYSNVDRNKNGKSRPFRVTGKGNYQNPTGLDKLSYDGHAGYDFVLNASTFQQPILAPADGILFIPDQDPITLHSNPSGAPESFAIMAIDHGNGFVTWYLHVGCIAGTTDGKKAVCSATDDNDYRGRVDPSTNQRVCSLDVLRNLGCLVHRGDVIGLAGNMGLSPNIAVSHLHFEVRIGLSARPSGLLGCDLPLCRPVDPYGWNPAVDSPVQVDPYSQYLGGAKAFSLWLQ